MGRAPYTGLHRFTRQRPPGRTAGEPLFAMTSATTAISVPTMPAITPITARVSVLAPRGRTAWSFGRTLQACVRKNSFGTSCCFHGRFGSAGHRPPRVSMAMAMNASGVWNPLARLVSARRCVFVASESALDRP